ncbi:hypothetical protein [Paenibacillus glycanilyticus]|uniref:Lipoprotein n=1 Tax=Paenibacillus glycanilyticus TaxID=126569 RepID=A0ABQ6GE96_9BACL|nr:hypothetical protein [Paenibacillus glycanilyticus]GLX67911.1 hypothetical protein MU1_22560 [Paenibacillus glycanilyticus]
MRKTIKYFPLLFLLIFATGCTNSGYGSMEEAIQNSGIQYKQIYYQYEVKKGVILFYVNPNGGIDAGLVYKNGKKFKWGFGSGTVSYPTDEEVTWGAANLDINAKTEEQKNYWIYYGIIKQADITKLHIEHKGTIKSINKDANIVELSDGFRLWFALQDEQNSIQPGFILDGYNKDGVNVYHFE